MKRVLTHSPWLGFTSYYHEINDPGCAPLVVCERVTHDTEGIQDLAAEKRNTTAGEKFGAYRHVASLPLNIYFQAVMQRHVHRDEKELRKLLNDRDLCKFRTFEGKL